MWLIGLFAVGAFLAVSFFFGELFLKLLALLPLLLLALLLLTTLLAFLEQWSTCNAMQSDPVQSSPKPLTRINDNYSIAVLY